MRSTSVRIQGMVLPSATVCRARSPNAPTSSPNKPLNNKLVLIRTMQNASLPTSTSPYDHLPVKYPPLAPEKLDRFLKERWVAQLGTVSKDSLPHVKPVWFIWEGGKVWIITWLRCKTVYNLQNNKNVAISIDSSQVPVSSFPEMGCLILGEGELLPEIKTKIEPQSWHFKIFAKYLGEEDCYKPPQSLHLSNPNMAIGVAPTKILSWDYTHPPDEGHLEDTASNLP